LLSLDRNLVDLLVRPMYSIYLSCLVVTAGTIKFKHEIIAFSTNFIYVFHANVKIKKNISFMSLYRVGRFDFPSCNIQCSMWSANWLFMYNVDFFGFKVLRNDTRFLIPRKVYLVFALSINLLIPRQKKFFPCIRCLYLPI